MIDALILDYGGVILHEDPADYDAIGAAFGFAPGQLWASVHSIPEYRPSRIGEVSAAEFENAVRSHLHAIAGAARADAAIAQLRDYYLRHAAVRAPMRELLASLRGRVRSAILSNAARGSTERFEQRGLLDLVDAILCSGDLGVAKPDPEAFRLAARRLGVAPGRCAFVDDVEENVQAARTLGMQALHYHHTRHAELVDALRLWGLGV
jgi:putative hydrolase of the HAD superfamily